MVPLLLLCGQVDQVNQFDLPGRQTAPWPVQLCATTFRHVHISNVLNTSCSVSHVARSLTADQERSTQCAAMSQDNDSINFSLTSFGFGSSPSEKTGSSYIPHANLSDMQQI